MDDQVGKSFKEKFFIDTTFIFSSTIIVNLILTINSIIVARMLGPEKLGIYSILQYISAILIVFASFNLPNALIKFIAEYRVKDKEVVGKIIGNILIVSFISLAFVSTALFVFSDQIANFYKESSLDFLIKIYVIVIFFNVLSNIGISIQAGFQNMKLISAIRVIITVIGLPVTILLIYFFELPGAILSLIINSLLLTAVSFFLLKKVMTDMDISIHFSVEKELILKIVNYAFPLFLSGILYTFFSWFGPTYLSRMTNFTDVGLFKVAFAIQTIILFIPTAINYNLIPTVSRLYSENSIELSIFISKILKFVVFITVPIVIVCLFISKDLILLLFGNNYLNSVDCTHILVISALFISLCASIGAIFMGIGITKKLLLIDTITCGIFVVSSALLIQKYGLMGLSYSYLITYIMVTGMIFYILSKVVKIKYNIIKNGAIIPLIFLPLSYVIVQWYTGLFLYALGIFMILLILFCEWRLLEEDDKESLITFFQKNFLKFNIKL